MYISVFVRQIDLQPNACNTDAYVTCRNYRIRVTCSSQATSGDRSGYRSALVTCFRRVVREEFCLSYRKNKNGVFQPIFSQFLSFFFISHVFCVWIKGEEISALLNKIPVSFIIRYYIENTQLVIYVIRPSPQTVLICIYKRLCTFEFC